MRNLAYQTEKEAEKPMELGRVITAQSLRYPRLLGKAWGVLPPSIQSRFTKFHSAGSYSIYSGEVLETRMSRAGKLLVLLGKLVKSPLPALSITTGPAMVIVREGEDLQTQCWTRIYPKRDQTNQLIQSVKRFTGPTGLVEMITPYMGLRLNVKAHADRLDFIADEYFLKVGRWNVTLPRFFAPGKMTVSHRMIDEDYFHFTLSLIHPYFGELIYQNCMFKESIE